MIRFSFFLLSVLLINLQSCQGQSQKISPASQKEFSKKWYQGEAELTTYSLEQARYGNMHPGEAVLIFVTEDFSKKKQVKLDNPGQAPDDAVKVMKLNAMRSFKTGIYEYNLMRSVFTPLDEQAYPRSLKITGSFQDWCGHSWMQYNLSDDSYTVEQFSYFESEGDQNYEMTAALLEDEVWTRIRTAPHTLPVGPTKMIPGIFYTRLKHTDHQPVNVVTSLEKIETGYRYTIDYVDLSRTLKIDFSDRFPFEINGWEESYMSGFGEDAEMLTTKATVKERLMIDYWRRNKPGDLSLRDKLGLEGD